MAADHANVALALHVRSEGTAACALLLVQLRNAAADERAAHNAIVTDLSIESAGTDEGAADNAVVTKPTLHSVGTVEGAADNAVLTEPSLQSSGAGKRLR